MSIVNELFAAVIEILGVPLFVFLALIALFLLFLGLRAQLRPSRDALESMVGMTGIVREGRSFRGRQSIEIRGERWWCTSGFELRPGMEVRVTGVEHMILEVEPLRQS